MHPQADTGGNLLLKIAGLWAMIGVTSWSEAASFAAFCLTVYLFARHIWRDIVRPFLEDKGIVKRHHKHARDDDDALGAA
jgi:hypothetical protein